MNATMEQQPCIRCARAIDAWAKICPYCNWDQSATPPAQEPPKPIAVQEYRPPSEFDLKKKAIFAGIGVLTLILAFVIGMVINSDDTPKEAPKTVEEQAAEELQAQQRQASPVRRADTTLVPAGEAGGIEQPITSAPVALAPGMPANDYQRTDATAVSSVEYTEMAKRAKAEKARLAAALDPRSLTGPAYTAPAPSRPRPAAPALPPSMASSSNAGADSSTPSTALEQPARRASLRTRPIPEYQPLPSLGSVGTAKLSLMIGADGRVKQVDIDRPLQRNTAQLISAVQSWRFKPATENGDPVAAPYSVEITFK